MFKSNIDQLRWFLQSKNIQAFIVPTSDPHKSEYIADYWKCREWITGFTGSAGTAVITASHAGLWTDSRYFVQANKQLVTPFVLNKLKTRTPEYIEWLAENLNPREKVGIDPLVFSWNEVDHFAGILNKKQIELCFFDDPFINFWTDRPVLPANKIYVHPDKFNGLSRSEKIIKVQEYINSNGSDQILITALDDIAWLFNLRGSDIEFNPVFRSYAIINNRTTYLFVDLFKISENLYAELKQDNIELKNYDEIFSFLNMLKPNTVIEFDGNTANYSLIKSVPRSCKLNAKASIISRFKSIKTSVEIANYKNAQIKDGVAMCNFIYWLEHEIKTHNITEIQAADKSEEFRSKQDHYIGLSFDVISAYQENAALPHYSPDKKNPVTLKPEGLYLIDSGAQYLDGTTDITRTIALGPVTKAQITDFTLVLKGHIRVALAKFPAGTKGFHLDTLARLDLWENGKDFGHGTGHGIGYFLNVHEGPQGFSQATTGPGNTIIEPGMFITNEPGYYREGNYGIRIENVLVCVKDKSTDTGDYLKFETVTYCPIDKKLIDKSLLTKTEINWLNNYHKLVFKLLAPFVSDDIKDWLKEKTLPL